MIVNEKSGLIGEIGQAKWYHVNEPCRVDEYFARKRSSLGVKDFGQEFQLLKYSFLGSSEQACTRKEKDFVKQATKNWN
ncbi:hypothetical protein [Desulfogranum marinum]|uniref:hypothetical protein n=1 Tax=Desulfogranum marinum TaxID=453220 RepID=UPI0029C89DE2|nr:hypothetical protein [Desulfogranum marinum]